MPYRHINFFFFYMPTNIFCTAGSEIAHASGFQVCPYFIGHGIGSHFHCYPEIWHHGKFRSVDDVANSCVTLWKRESTCLFFKNLNFLSFFFFFFSANDNDMTMDEGMAFTIGELPFQIFAIRCNFVWACGWYFLLICRAHIDGGVCRV